MELPRSGSYDESQADAELADNLASRMDIARRLIRNLEKKAYSGAYILSAFIVLSIAAVHNFSFLPSFSLTVRKSMGTGPSSGFISIALVIYVFSAVILSLSRMMEGSEKIGGFSHLGYLGAFFFFYHFSGDMDEQFWAVFAGGATILSLESYQRWHFCRDEIMKEREVLQELEAISRQKGLPLGSRPED